MNILKESENIGNENQEADSPKKDGGYSMDDLKIIGFKRPQMASDKVL